MHIDVLICHCRGRPLSVPQEEICACPQMSRFFSNGALRAFEDQRWDDVIYSYEMAVEQALKGILILYGIEYPKKHDISNIFLELKNKNIPDFYVKKIDNHSQVLKTLVDKRGPAAYGYIEGYEKEDFKKEPRDLKSKVKEIIKDCRRLLNEFNKKGTSN